MELETVQSATQRFELELSGRRYPAIALADNEVSLDPQQQGIVNTLWSRLGLPDSNVGDTNSIVATYDADRQLIAFWRGQLRSLFAAIGEASLELRSHGAHSSTELGRLKTTQLESIKAKFEFPQSRLDQALSADLLVQPTSVVRNALVEELRSKVQSLVTDLYSALDRLVNNEGVGLIQWLNGSLCKFHFFRDVVVHELQKSTAHETRTVSRPDSSGQFVTTVSEVRAQSGVNTQRLARHEHELINAVAESVQECSLIIPRTVQRVVELIPDWLQPLAKIVSGDCIRERVIERDLHVREWESTDSEVVRVYFDPAVTLGYYVLVGWNEEDIFREEQAQLSEQFAAETQYKLIRAKKEAWVASITGLAFLICAPGIAFIAAVISTWIYFAAACLGVLGLVSFAYGLYQYRMSKKAPADYEWIFTVVALGGFTSLLVAAVGVALLSPSLTAWAVALVSFAIAAFIARHIEPPRA